MNACRLAWIGALALLGCTDITGTSEDAAGTQDPEQYKTPIGALGLYRNIAPRFGFEVVNTAITGGLMTDELQISSLINNTNPLSDPAQLKLDARNPIQDVRETYIAWQTMRVQSQHAIAFITKYGPDLPKALSGELYAIEGYSVMTLADFFCSGVPLSTIDFEKTYTYAPGSTTSELYSRAVSLFDSALVLGADSVRIVNLARVGKGRALIALGQYADADAAVADVPSTFRYSAPVTWKPAASLVQSPTFGCCMADKKGINGLDFRTANDPRIDTVFIGNTNGIPQYFPKKFPLGVASNYTIADWTEAQLIRAEAKLQAQDISGWLGVLNQLRTTTTPVLPALDDPGSDSARVDLLFRERAFWLYLGGQRQGDLRRLIRLYHRTVDEVYPTGNYPGFGKNIPQTFGTDIVLPLPETETTKNPLVKGCINYDA